MYDMPIEVLSSTASFKPLEVFVASELDAIEQVPAGQDPKISRAKMPKKLPTFEKAQNKARYVCWMLHSDALQVVVVCFKGLWLWMVPFGSLWAVKSSRMPQVVAG